MLYNSVNFKDKPIFKIMKFTSLNALDFGPKEVCKLTKLIATILSTIVSVGRRFSAFTRIKTYCTSTEDQGTLSSPGILSIKKSIRNLKISLGFYYNVTEECIKKN